MRRCLEKGGVGRDVALHSYVLMTNHIHLLLTAEDDTGVSRLIQSAAGRYVAYFNRKYDRTGTLWEGRFFSAVVTTDHYLMACHRYIDLNPVRAGLVQTAEDYRWSSHRHYAFGSKDALVTEHPLILALSENTAVRRSAYRELFESELSSSDLDAIRCATRGRRLLGGVAARQGQHRGRPQEQAFDPRYCAGHGTARSCEPV